MSSNQVKGMVEVMPSTQDGGDLLNSWREIARYLGRGIRTVQRWEAQSALPVLRPRRKKGNAVIARRSEIDAWVSAFGVHPDRGGVERRSPQLATTLLNFSQLQLKFRKNMDDFIQTEVELGCTFAFVALAATDPTKRARNLHSADRAYCTAYRSFLKHGVSSRDLRSDIVDRLAYLRTLLDGGPIEDGAQPVLGILERAARGPEVGAEAEAG